MDVKIESYKRKTVFSELKQFDVLTKEHSFIEVIEWKNKEGVDVNISSYSEKFISLTWGEIDAIKKLTKKLLKE
jgi:hypothetical protein